MEQDLTGYKTPLGTLVYGSEEDNIYYFVKTENNLWLYNIESGILRVLDSTNVEIARTKFKYRYNRYNRYKKHQVSIELKDRVKLFRIGQDSIAIEINRNTKKSSVFYLRMVRGRLKKSRVGLGRHILHSKTYPLSKTETLHAKEVYGNNLYLLHDGGNKVDTVYAHLKNAIAMVYGFESSIDLVRGSSQDFYVLDKLKKILYSYHITDKELKVHANRSQLREVFAWTKGFMTFDVKLLYDIKEEVLYLLAKKNIRGTIQSVLYRWAGTGFEVVEVPSYDSKLDQYFNAHQIFRNDIYFVRHGYFGAKNKYIHKIRLAPNR